MRLVVSLLLVFALIPTAYAAAWMRYENPEFGYSVELPDDGFDVEADPTRHGVTLYENAGRGQIDVYAIDNDRGLTLKQVRDALSNADRIKDITYSRGGTTWFVVSGYYRGLEDEANDLIFYAKFMISADRRAISAFEVSYPIEDKRRYDTIVERMEDSLTPPRS
jgi:hypothetical protein